MFSHPATTFICRRCEEDAGLDPEICFFCQGPLCEACWSLYGHCGHPEAEAMNEQARKVNQEGES